MEEREPMPRWVDAWTNAGPPLEAIRRTEIQQADNLAVESRFNDGANRESRIVTTPTPGNDFLFGDSSLRNTPAVQSSVARVKITDARNTTGCVPRRRREVGAKRSAVLSVRTMTIRL